MRWSRFYLFTTREVPGDAEVVSHQLMARAGMIRKVAAGIYSYLPLGWRSISKMMEIVRREMDAAGAVELVMPAVQPAELWQETERWEVFGDLLLRIKDRNERDFCFGPTHEEVVTDIVRRDVRSYRQLPFNLYQIQTKFRDEIRPRFGLMRAREFLMKDAYSFHTNEESLAETYEAMRQAYCRVFEDCRLEYSMVEAASGAIGGSGSHEFMVLAETGEDAVVACSNGDYAANAEKAETSGLEPSPAEEPIEMREESTPSATTVAAVTKLLGVGPEKLVKTMLYDTDVEPVAVLVRGDREVNEVKLAGYLGVNHLQLAGEEKVRRFTGAPVGFAGPVGLSESVRLIGDESARPLVNFVCGANKADAHLVGVNFGRDVEIGEWADLLLVGAGDPCPRCDGTLELSRGIEVGHIFMLGSKYSKAMECFYSDEKGERHPMEMGCYGLGIGRTVAAAIEQNHDKDGIIWPLPLAPFEVLVMSLNPQDPEVSRTADQIYDQLVEQGVDVFYDDRDERPGVKFKDADLIGIPIRVAVGAKSLAEGKVELSLRRDREKHLVTPAEAAARVRDLLAELGS
ncbi:MAG: proline--tRNA ligase [Thermoanaerobaculia bacterium]